MILFFFLPFSTILVQFFPGNSSLLTHRNFYSFFFFLPDFLSVFFFFLTSLTWHPFVSVRVGFFLKAAVMLAVWGLVGGRGGGRRRRKGSWKGGEQDRQMPGVIKSPQTGAQAFTFAWRMAALEASSSTKRPERHANKGREETRLTNVRWERSILRFENSFFFFFSFFLQISSTLRNVDVESRRTDGQMLDSD